MLSSESGELPEKVGFKKLIVSAQYTFLRPMIKYSGSFYHKFLVSNNDAILILDPKYQQCTLMNILISIRVTAN